MRTNAKLLALAAVAAGCSGLSAEMARSSYMKDQMAERVFPATCADLWADGLKVLAQSGYQLVGTDRGLAGQDARGFVGSLLAAGHATTRNAKGVWESETDWNSERLRYQMKGYPDGVDGCQVRITAMKEEGGEVGETRKWRDFEMELAVLARVAPKQAAAVEAGSPKEPR